MLLLPARGYLRMASGRWGKQECESALAESRSCRLLASVLVPPLSFLVARSGITVLLLCSPNALALLPSSAILFIIRNTSYAVSYFTIKRSRDRVRRAQLLVLCGRSLPRPARRCLYVSAFTGRVLCVSVAPAGAHSTCGHRVLENLSCRAAARRSSLTTQHHLASLASQSIVLRPAAALLLVLLLLLSY